MREIIFDTDLGVDCDDAVALSLLMQLQRAGEIMVTAVTASSTREGASSTATAIMDYYGQSAPIAHMRSPVLIGDGVNNYARAVLKRYGHPDVDELPVPLLRRTLANATQKQILLAVGPLSNLAALLDSTADRYSDLSGVDLVAQKVSVVYAMAGRFDCDTLEWNVMLDVPAARTVIECYPVPVVFVPFEVGLNVLTGMPLKNYADHPAWYSMRLFAINEFGRDLDDEQVARESWDPITTLLATGRGAELFVFERGTVHIDDRGVTTFTPHADGQHTVVRSSADPEAVRAAIDGLL